MKYPRKIATLAGRGGRRVVTVYEVSKGRWRVYLRVDGAHVDSQSAASKASAMGAARAWT